jgi:hypothetical protein
VGVVRVACVLTVDARTQLNVRKCLSAVACNQGTMFTND